MKYYDKELKRERYFDRNGVEIHDGDFIKLYPNAKPKRVYEFEDECGYCGLGLDATNPAWIESGRAVPCEYGIYPLEASDTDHCEVCGRD